MSDAELALSILHRLVAADDMGYVSAEDGVFDVRVTLTDDEEALVERLLGEARAAEDARHEARLVAENHANGEGDQ